MGRYAETGAEMVWGLDEAASGIPGRGLRAVVRVLPAHPANAVKAVLTQAGRADREVRGHGIGADPVTGAQMFAVDLPAMPPGVAALWRPVLMRSGRVVDPRLGGQAPEALPVPSAPPPLPAAASVPVRPAPFAFLPQYLFRVSVPIRPDVRPIGETPDGLHFYFELDKGGTVRGPALDAEVLGLDGDRLRIRPDGVGVVDAAMTLTTADGGTVFMTCSGLVDTGPDGYAALASGQGAKAAPIRYAPRYLTATPSLMWLNRVQSIGIGQVSLERMLVEYDVYAFGPADLPI